MKFCAAWMLVLALAAAFPGASGAQEPPKPQEKIDPVKESTPSVATLFLLTEGLFAANSGLATLSPRAYGAAGLLLLPLGYAQGTASMENTVGTALFAGLCLYNLIIPDRRDFSSGQLFTTNMIGWHLFALGIGAAAFFRGEEALTTRQALRFDIQIGRDGPMVMAQYRF